MRSVLSLDDSTPFPQQGLHAVEPLVDLANVLGSRGGGTAGRLARSSVARATNELVIAAVITVRKASPSSITSAATIRPEVLVGTTSP